MKREVETIIATLRSEIVGLRQWIAINDQEMRNAKHGAATLRGELEVKTRRIAANGKFLNHRCQLCGETTHLLYLYRCFYCRHFFCDKCAKDHFETKHKETP
ncbi:hypothetical protein LCGC14_2363370 [marine sediment metagenome]|uniref:Uncharacterized protein n=1 Tax=marine sediment metagenome TaxID=412755 RepID=A0A0F9CTC9_9ZZZZ